MKSGKIIVLLFLFSFLINLNLCYSCTSFCINTSEGPVFGANLDFGWGDGLIVVNKRNVSKEGYQTGTTGETAKWTSKYGSITINLLGKEYAWCGMNEAGLVISTMWLNESVLPEPDERPPVVSGFWVQYQLDNFSSIEEVIYSDSLIRITDDLCHFLVCDSTGACVTIEFLEGSMVYHTRKTMPVNVLTNHPYADAIKLMDTDSLTHSSTVVRFNQAVKKVQDYVPVSTYSSIDYAMDILTNFVKAPHTKWSIVFDIKSRKFTLRTFKNPEIRTFSLDSFDFSCSSTVRILDVNANLSGNIAPNFTEYNHDKNLNLFYNFCKWWGVEITWEESEEFMQFLGGFPCIEE